MSAKDAIASLRDLHRKWSESKQVYSIAFPWAAGEVVEFAADRDGSTLGLRDLYVLSDLPPHQRAGFLELLQTGAFVESLAVAPEPPPPPAAPTRRKKAAA